MLFNSTGRQATDTGFVSRDDQLRFKSTKKEARKDKKSKSESKKPGKGGKRKQKKSRKPKSKAKKSRRRQILSAASAAAKPAAEEACEVVAERKRKGKKEEAAAAAEIPAAPAKNLKAKAKAAAAKEPKKRPAEQGAKPKGAAKKRKTSSEEAMVHRPLRMDDIVKALMEWALQFPEKFEDSGAKAAFRAAVREALVPLTFCSLNVYWTRCGCGVKQPSSEGDDLDKVTKKDVCHFSWNSSPAAPRHKLAVAIRCAELAAPCLCSDLEIKYGRKRG